MKFYDFIDFGYYALIGAEDEETAVEYYHETIADSTDEEPKEITEKEALDKLLAICKTDEERAKAEEVFYENVGGGESYLILFDSSLM